MNERSLRVTTYGQGNISVFFKDQESSKWYVESSKLNFMLPLRFLRFSKDCKSHFDREKIFYNRLICIPWPAKMPDAKTMEGIKKPRKKSGKSRIFSSDNCVATPKVSRKVNFKIVLPGLVFFWLLIQLHVFMSSC